MSKFTASAPKSIPMGILVSASSKQCKAIRPVPTRKATHPRRLVPWGWIASGGGAVTWMLMLAILAICIPARRRSTPQPDLAQVVNQQPALNPAVKPAAIETTPKPAESNPGDVKVPELVSAQRLAQLESKPMLVRQRPLTRPDDIPPPLDLSPPKQTNEKPQLGPTEQIAVTPTPCPADRNIYADCEKIGTKVPFMKNPPDAFKRAKAEKKMVFMVHLSGNLEDRACT